MRILFVTGSDYAALTVEQEIGIDAAIQMCESGQPFPDDTTDISASIIDFGPVDPSFVQFVRDNIMDYDQAKSTNFWVINE